MKTEEYLGVVKTTKGLSSFSLFFTTNRIIIAKKGAFDHAVDTGAKSVKNMKEYKKEKLMQVVPQDIIDGHEDNIGISYKKIKKFFVKKPTAFGMGKIVITTGKGERKFGMANLGLFGIHDNDFDFLFDLPPEVTNVMTVKG